MISIQFNDSAFKKAMAEVGKQLQFACAVALTKTAQDAQAEVRRELPIRFISRTNWVAQGIQVKAASKNDLTSSVMVLDQFMVLQETGGIKTSPFGHALGVPIGARPSPTSITRPGSFPGAMLKRPGYFIAPVAKNASVHAVWRRIGKGKQARKKLMYVLPHQVSLKPRFGFYDTVRKVTKENFPKRFAEAWQQALATAR